MENNQSVFFDRLYNPVLQAVIVLGISILGMLVIQGCKYSGSVVVNDSVFWVVAGASILFFGLFNSIISLGASDMNKYWYHSTASYAVLMLLCGSCAYLFSSLTITEAGTFKWIFMVLTFGYLLFLSIMRFMRKVVQIAQEEDDKWMGRLKKKNPKKK